MMKDSERISCLNRQFTVFFVVKPFSQYYRECKDFSTMYSSTGKIKIYPLMIPHIRSIYNLFEVESIIAGAAYLGERKSR